MLHELLRTIGPAMTSQTWAEISGGALAFVVLLWFALRYWIASTRDPRIDEIPTPTIDRMNASALEKMRIRVEAAEAARVGDAAVGEVENAGDADELVAPPDEAAPADLLQVVPEDEHLHAAHLKHSPPSTNRNNPSPAEKPL